jgi:hypothetical protein
VLGDKILQTYLCEKAGGHQCAICPDKIKDREIYFVLFQDDATHAPLPIHRQCARAALEKFILNKERKQKEGA